MLSGNTKPARLSSPVVGKTATFEPSLDSLRKASPSNITVVRCFSTPSVSQCVMSSTASKCEPGTGCGALGLAVGLFTASSESAGAGGTVSAFGFSSLAPAFGFSSLASAFGFSSLGSSFFFSSLASSPVRMRAVVMATSSRAAHEVALPMVMSVPPRSTHDLRPAPLPSVPALASGMMMTLNADKSPLSDDSATGVNLMP